MSSRRPACCRARCGSTWSDPVAASNVPRWWPWTAARTWLSWTCRRPACGALLGRRRAEPGTPFLTLGSCRRRHGDRARTPRPARPQCVGAAIPRVRRGGLASITSSAAGADGHRRRTATGLRRGGGRHPLRPRPAPPPPSRSSPVTWSSASPTTCVRGGRVGPGGSGSRAPTPRRGGAMVESVGADGPAADRLVAGRGDRGRRTTCPCARWPSCGPASTCSTRAPGCALGAGRHGRHDHRGRHPRAPPP